jgi:hypothetical protein
VPIYTGAENLAPAAERSSMADQTRAAYENIKAEKAALDDGNEQGNSQDQDGGRGAAAAFRSFGRYACADSRRGRKPAQLIYWCCRQ